MLKDTLSLLRQEQISGAQAGVLNEVCRVAVWFARRARDKGKVGIAQQVLDSLQAMLGSCNHDKGSFSFGLLDQLSSPHFCGGAAVGATAMLLCSAWQAMLFLTCLACVLAYRLLHS